MQDTHIWNKFNLYCRKVVFLLGLFLCFQNTSFGQASKVKVNLPNYDNRKIHYGFQLGINYTTFRLSQSQAFLESDTIQRVYARGSNGFALGFLFNYRLAEFFDLRFTPYVGFYERVIRFEIKDVEEPSDAIFQSSIIELPWMVKYKSARRGNYRMYMLGGMKMSAEVGAKKKQQKSTKLSTNSVDWSIEYGLGLDIYYPLFKFSPELRFSYGLSNLFVKDDNIFSRNIDRLSTFTTTLFFFFE